MTSTTDILGAPEVRRTAFKLPGFRAIAIFVVFSIPAAITAFGLPYYLLDRAARLRSDLHPALKSSGPLGLALGFIGFGLFVFMWLYPLRRKFSWLSWTGPVGAWIQVHSVVGLLIPLIVAVHASWRFDGLIGLGYLSMFVVSLSGLVGRYLYTHIPRGRDGAELTAEETAGERRALITRIAAATGFDPREIEKVLAPDTRTYAGLGLLGTVRRLVSDDLRRRRAIAALRGHLTSRRSGPSPISGETLREVLRLARREIALHQQARMLEGTRKVFALWHVAHRPFSITALLAVLIHVVVALWVGAVGM